MKGILKIMIVSAGCRGWLSERTASFLLRRLGLVNV